MCHPYGAALVLFCCGSSPPERALFCGVVTLCRPDSAVPHRPPCPTFLGRRNETPVESAATALHHVLAISRDAARPPSAERFRRPPAPAITSRHPHSPNAAPAIPSRHPHLSAALAIHPLFKKSCRSRCGRFSTSGVRLCPVCVCCVRCCCDSWRGWCHTPF